MTHTHDAPPRAALPSDLYYAGLFLPRQQRHALLAFDGFCTAAREVVKTVSDLDVAAKKLAWWHHELRQTYAGQPSHPLMHAWLPVAKQYAIDETLLHRIIDGCETDLMQTRYLDESSLNQYCDAIAGSAGEVCARICDASPSCDASFARTLWVALEQTRLLCNVGADAVQGRIYLPVSLLQRFDVKAHEILNRTNSERFQALMQFQTSRIHALHDAALSQLPAAQRTRHKPSLILASLSRSVLGELQAQNFPVLSQRVVLTPLRKLWLAWKMQALGRS